MLYGDCKSLQHAFLARKVVFVTGPATLMGGSTLPGDGSRKKISAPTRSLPAS
jgi:hypothetical protein